MAEFKIKTITFNGDWANIELEDGRKVSGNKTKEPKFAELKDGDTIEGDIKEWKKDDKISLFFNFAKAANGSKFPAKDYTFKKRKASLDAAIAAINILSIPSDEGVVTSVGILQTAETFFQYLNKK